MQELFHSNFHAIVAEMFQGKNTKIVSLSVSCSSVSCAADTNAEQQGFQSCVEQMAKSLFEHTSWLPQHPNDCCGGISCSVAAEYC